MYNSDDLYVSGVVGARNTKHSFTENFLVFIKTTFTFMVNNRYMLETVTTAFLQNSNTTQT